MHFREEIGRWGENLACQYLKNNNYEIMERNFLCRQGEIDLIAKDLIKKELVFIEVKTRSNLKYGNPVESVNKEKQKRMLSAIQYYLYKHQITHVPIRLDVIEVYIMQNYHINHIKQIL